MTGRRCGCRRTVSKSAATPAYVTVLVIGGQRMTLVIATWEFDLGVVGPDERIVRELEGTRTVGATVVKAAIARGGR
jgi:hypothetical protein